MKADLKIKKLYKGFWSLIGICFMAAAASLIISATYADKGPELTLKHCVNQSISILNNPAYKNKPQKEIIRTILFDKCKPTFDFMALSMGVLGRNWRRFSPEQRKEFSKYFSHLIAQIYFEKLDKQSIKSISIRYIKTTMLPPTRSGIERADVTTEVTHNGVKTPVIYRMLKRKHGTWKIYDIKIEGVSLVANYREQYRNKFMETPEQIIKELKEKVKM